jgi:hypothetical protein
MLVVEMRFFVTVVVTGAGRTESGLRIFLETSLNQCAGISLGCEIRTHVLSLGSA